MPSTVMPVLLFGKPIGELVEGEQGTLGRRATDVATRYGITALSRSIAVEYAFWPGWTLVTSTETTGQSSVELRWKTRY
jgi:hypothetical protein